MRKCVESAKLGRISFSTCLEVDARRLTINLTRAEDLPKFGICGPPDPCVRIILEQNNFRQTKQTRILKSTYHPVFKEAVMFLVSAKEDDLNNTCLTISVVDTSLGANVEDVIGQVVLGKYAKSKISIDQWRNTIRNPGKEIKATHALRSVEENLELKVERLAS
ncbi:unnamed protein product [Soboliphyme baturini]|uniref:C2 domain-containing protein n=1 Tax=Soboliphyme baturini TaxID=241478 RepID=A0A183IV37_9BILA|nr:unnamed protein product [Soboliphyme baturini]